MKKTLSAILPFCLSAILVAAPTVKGPEHGTLVIVGGGKLVPEILTKFFDLAGGKDAPVVVVPTAAGQESYQIGRAHV